MNLETINPALGGQSRARHFAERVNFEIIKSCARRRVREGVDAGERAPAGPAAAAMELTEISEVEAVALAVVDGEAAVLAVSRRVTGEGEKTARRKIPRVLSRMDPQDMRRRAADAYAIAAERIGSIAGASYNGDQVDGGSSASDGGASTRMEHAVVLRRVAAAVADDAGAPRVALAPGNARGDRKPIMAADLIRAVCIDGRDLKEILRAHGWSGQSRDVVTLAKVVEALLERMAFVLGFNVGMRVRV